MKKISRKKKRKNKYLLPVIIVVVILIIILLFVFLRGCSSETESVVKEKPKDTESYTCGQTEICSGSCPNGYVCESIYDINIYDYKCKCFSFTTHNVHPDWE